MSQANPQVVIISGPSGSGKSTVVSRVLERCTDPIRLSVSATTRAPRAGEVDGEAYHFLTHEDFARRREAGDFLEFKEVFGRGEWYGTLGDEVSSGLNAGQSVILEIDVQGAMSVVDQIPDAITIFLHPGSLTELERRLRQRGTDTEEAMQRRLQVARDELAYLPRYTHEVINESIDQAAEEICQIIRQSGEAARC